MPHRVFASFSLLTLALAIGRGEPLSRHPFPPGGTHECAAVGGATPQPASSGVPDAATGDLRYRMIGPHRGGRTKAAVGIPDRLKLFYIGVVNGGVWNC